MKILISLFLTIITALSSIQSFAQQLIPFQARLTDGTGAVAADGVYPITFNIYDAATAGTPLWTETHSTVSVVGGVVSVILGSITPLNDPDKNGDFSDAVTFYATSGERFIGITIDTGQEMVPRHQLIPSFHASTADDAKNAEMANDAVRLGGNLPSHYVSLSQHNADVQALTNKVNNLAPGLIGAFSGSCPAGWILADGTSGTPDLRGRFLRGEPTGNSASLNFGGNDNAVVVSHTHTGTISNAGNHTHPYSAGTDGAKAPYAGGGGWELSGYDPAWAFHQLKYDQTAGNHTHGLTINSAGEGGTGKNIPKYYEVIYCVKQ